jgi:DNA (cytosine-5)-methyltransferase 1
LNAFDNGGESRATVLIIDGTRVGDVRVYEDEIMQKVIQRWGTGGGNVPLIFGHTQGLDIQASETTSPTLRKNGGGSAVMLDQTSPHAQTFIAESITVRRLTPRECERLQGFPDDWTAEQSDSQRYKQMGNAVTVNVIEWIGSRL